MYRFILPLLLLALSACTNPSFTDELARAQALIQSDSKQALSILDSISEFTEVKRNDRLSMEAHYLRGVIYAQNAQYSEAMQEALAAEYGLTKIPYDAYWSGRVQMLLGTIYDAQKLYNKSIDRFRAAAEHFRNFGRNDFSQRALFYMAETYAYAYQPDSAITYLKEILKQDGEADDFLEFNARRALIYAYISKEQYDSAMIALRQFERAGFSVDKNSEPDLLRTEIFTNLGNADSARYYLNRIVRSNPEAENYAITHYFRAKLDSMQGDYRSAYAEANIALKLNDEVSRAKDNAYAASVEKDFMNKLMKEEEAQAARKRRDLIFIVGLLTVVCAVLLYIMYRHRRIHRTVIEQNMADVIALKQELDRAACHEQQLSRQLDESRGLLSELTERLAEPKSTFVLPELFRESFRTLDALSSQYFAMQGSPAQERQSMKEFERELARLRSPQAAVQIILTANECFGNILRDLTTEVPLLSEKDVLLLAYQMLGFSAKSISLFLELSLANFYKKRTRLMTRIEKSGFSRLNELKLCLECCK